MRLIVEEDAGSLTVYVRWTDDGDRERQGKSTAFESPLALADLEELRFYLEDYLSLPSGVFADRGRKVENEKLAEWGEALFRAVFEHPNAGPERRNAFVQLRATAVRGHTADLAVSSRNARFLALPWELLKAPEDGQPIALSISSFDRTVPQPAAPFVVPDASRGVRMLMVIARPEGVRDAPFHSIARRLFRHVAALGDKISAEILRPPSFAAFQRKLKEGADAGEPFHVVHFDGHGDFGVAASGASSPDWFYKSAAPQGFLCFETEGGAGAELVSAADFAAALKAGRTPCVVLNACRSGTFQTIDDAVGPEATVATRLIDEGVASVVAMSHSVYVVAASAFMATFYERLFAGDAVSRALNDARRALARGANALRPSLGGRLIPLKDWMVPVHYQRARIRLPGLAPRGQRARTADQILADFNARISDQSGRAAADDVLAPMDGVFLGRDAEFYKLERAVRGPRVCVVCGVAGTGKTELAKAFGRWLQLSRGVDHPALVFFQSFEPGRVGFGVDQIIDPIFELFTRDNDALRLANDAPEQREALVLQFLASVRCLLIWDNFETASSMPTENQATLPLDQPAKVRMSAFLKALKASKSAVLITSRAPEEWIEVVPSAGGRALLTPGDVARIEVGGLSEADALAYADHILSGRADAQQNRQKDEAGFKALLAHLSGHPLCLKLSLRHLDAMTPTAVLVALRGEGAALPEALEAGRLAALGASMRYSLRHLSQKDREHLFVLALAEDTVSVIALGEMEDPPQRIAGLDVEGWDPLLTRAADLGLITKIGGGIYGCIPPCRRP